MRVTLVLALAIGIAGCGREPANEGAAQNEAAALPAAPAPAAIVLRGDGLGPGLTFGIDEATARAALDKATGKVGDAVELSECGQGPLTSIDYGALSATIIDRRFVGWFQSEANPSLKAEDGLAVGAPRRTLGATKVEESTLGMEFRRADGLSGLLDERGTAVQSLWAGEVCMFR